MTFKTSDGYTLTFKNGSWTDGDLVFPDLNGWPMTSWAEKLDGHHIEEGNQLTQGGYLVLVQDGDVLRDCEEGPWGDYDCAEGFARSEVGFPWIIVRVVSVEGKRGA